MLGTGDQESLNAKFVLSVGGGFHSLCLVLCLRWYNFVSNMTIIVFLIDTSASMNQRGYLGGRPTLLDVAKGAVETFVKVRK